MAAARVAATVARGSGCRAVPAASAALSGSATKHDAAICGVNAENQAVRFLSVVPVLPATGRPTIPWTMPAVGVPPQLPRAAPYPVTQRAASVAARATSWLNTRWQRGASTRTDSPLAVVIAGLPLRSVIELTGSGSQ